MKMTFIRLATKSKDGMNGFLYRQSWSSGYQDLIFESHEQAKRFV